MILLQSGSHYKGNKCIRDSYPVLLFHVDVDVDVDGDVDGDGERRMCEGDDLVDI